jgi:hypothetical protein
VTGTLAPVVVAVHARVELDEEEIAPLDLIDDEAPDGDGS